MQSSLFSITCFCTCTCFRSHERKLVDEKLDFYVCSSSCFVLFFLSEHRKRFDDIIFMQSIEREYSFCRSFHSWFSNSGLILTNKAIHPLRRSRMKSSPWGCHRSVRGGFWTMPMSALFFQSRGPTEARYCVTDCCLTIKASSVGHECTSVRAWKRTCCRNVVLHCYSQPYLAESTSYQALSLLSQRMTQCHQLSSPCNNFTYLTWHSFSDDQLVAASQSTQTALHNDTGNTFVTGSALHVRRLLQCITWLFLNLAR